MYTQNHTRKLLLEEKKQLGETLSKLRGDNAISDRAIKQGKLAASKKEEANKQLREERERLHEDIEELSAEIFALGWEKDLQLRKLHSKDLTKKAQAEKQMADQENSLVAIDISIAESRIKDLENQKKMTNQQIEEILTEKRKVDKENLELEFKIQGRGVTDADQKLKYQVAERKMTMQLQHSN